MTTAPSVLGRAGGPDRPGDLVAAARELQPLLRENSAAGEEAGQLTGWSRPCTTRACSGCGCPRSSVGLHLTATMAESQHFQAVYG